MTHSLSTAAFDASDAQQKEGGHVPVLCQEVVDLFLWAMGKISAHCPRETLNASLNTLLGGDLPFPIFLDATFGRGGHSLALLKAFPNCAIVAMDRDPSAIAFGQKNQALFPPQRVVFSCTPFSRLFHWRAHISAPHGASVPDWVHRMPAFDGIFMDLGVSSPQIDTPHRGFSFRHTGPLDMRMSQNGPTAAYIVNTYSQEALENIFYTYGQEKSSRAVARAIVQQRIQQPFSTTTELANVADRVIKRTKNQKGRHSATKIFQALRIAVNQELDELRTGLSEAITVLAPGGCLGVITFHSLEDRIVKNVMRYDSQFLVRNKSPVSAGDVEKKENPRSASAHLRWAVKAYSALSQQAAL